MNATSERIRNLVASGKISADEGERLLAAMHEPSRPAWQSMLLNPFDRLGGGPAAAIGLVVAALSVAVTRLGVSFDGALDLHDVSKKASTSLLTTVIEQGTDWIVVALLFWACSLVLSRHGRLLDFLGMVGLARLPYLLVAPPIVALSPTTIPNPPKLSLAIAAIAFLGLCAIVWMITWLYQGFKNASGLQGRKLVLGFIVTLVIAEAATKAILAFAV